MLITKQKAAKILGVSPAVFTHELKHDEIPAYFERDQDGVWRVNIESPAWRARVLSRAASGRKRADAKRSVAAKTKHAVRMLAEDNDDENEGKPKRGRKKQELPDDPKMKKLAQLALEAQMKKDIYQADSAKEKLEQDKLKTLEMKRELGPMGLITYWFSFADNLIQRIHRRPNEVWPEIEALILGHESDKALLKIKRELEAVIIAAQKELRDSIESEGYDNIK